jgi:hypothetical protein
VDGKKGGISASGIERERERESRRAASAYKCRSPDETGPEPESPVAAIISHRR